MKYEEAAVELSKKEQSPTELITEGFKRLEGLREDYNNIFKQRDSLSTDLDRLSKHIEEIRSGLCEETKKLLS